MTTAIWMRGVKTASKYLLAILMIGVGTLHFVRHEFFVKIMPPYLPWHLELVYLSGFFEAALGLLLLVPRTSRLAAWGIIALLIAVFPANIFFDCRSRPCSFCGHTGTRSRAGRNHVSVIRDLRHLELMRLGTQGQHWTGSSANHILSDAAHDHMRQTGASVSGQHN